MSTENAPNPLADEIASLVAETNGEAPPATPPPGEPPAGDPPASDPPPGDPPPADPPAGDPPPGGTDTSDTTDVDLVEVDGKKYFYHPSVHAKGEETHPNSYASRDDAELAAIAKVERMRELATQLKEKGKSVRTLKLPGVIGNDPSKLESMTEEEIIAMESKDLQGFLKESDQFIKRASSKAETLEKETTRSTMNAEMQQKLETTKAAAQTAIQTLNIDLNKQYSDPDAFFADLDAHIQTQVDTKLKKDIDTLAAFKKDEDKLDELGPAKFADEIERQINAIAEKRRTLTAEYQGHKQSLTDYLALKDQAAETPPDEVKPTPAQILQNRAGSWEEFQNDLGDLPHMQSKEKAKAFYAWATRHADQYSNLQHTDDFVEAYEAYDKHIETLRAKHRKQQLESQEAEKRAAEERAKDIPPPDPNFNYRNTHDRFAKMNKEMDDLAAESNKIK